MTASGHRPQLVRPAGLDPTAPYAFASIVGPGSLVLTAGACPLDEAGAVVHPGDPTPDQRLGRSASVTTRAASAVV